MQNYSTSLEFRSFTSKLNTSQKSLCFIDSISHFRKVKQIKERAMIDMLFITNKQNVIRELKNAGDEYIYFNNYLSLIVEIFKLRHNSFNFLLAACVDQMYFQIIYFACKFSFFSSFDEGIFSVDQWSRYNSEKVFSFKSHKLYFCLEKIFKYPKVPNYFLKVSFCHFGWFHKDLYQNTVVEKKLLSMSPSLSNDHARNLKVFIGQPFNWMGLTESDKSSILGLLKKEKMDFYIQHPRETKKNSIISKTCCPILSIDFDAESFLSIFSGLKLEVYSYRSSILFGLDPSTSINIISFEHDREPSSRHDAFLSMLKKSKIEFQPHDL